MSEESVATKRQRTGARTRSQTAQAATATANNRHKSRRPVDMSVLKAVSGIPALTSETASYLTPREQSLVLRTGTQTRQNLESAFGRTPPSINVDFNVPGFLRLAEQESKGDVRAYFRRAVQVQHHNATCLNLRFWPTSQALDQYRRDTPPLDRGDLDGLLEELFATFKRLRYVFIFDIIPAYDQWRPLMPVAMHAALLQAALNGHLNSRLTPIRDSLQQLLPWNTMRVLHIDQMHYLGDFAQYARRLSRFSTISFNNYDLFRLPKSVQIMQCTRLRLEPFDVNTTAALHPFNNPISAFTLPQLRYLAVSNEVDLSRHFAQEMSYTSVLELLPNLTYADLHNSLLDVYELAQEEHMQLHGGRFQLPALQHARFLLPTLGTWGWITVANEQAQNRYESVDDTHPLLLAFPVLRTLTLDCAPWSDNNRPETLIHALPKLLHGLLLQKPDLRLYLLHMNTYLRRQLAHRLGPSLLAQVTFDQPAPEFQAYLDSQDELGGADHCRPRVPRILQTDYERELQQRAEDEQRQANFQPGSPAYEPNSPANDFDLD